MPLTPPFSSHEASIEEAMGEDVAEGLGATVLVGVAQPGKLRPRVSVSLELGVAAKLLGVELDGTGGLDGARAGALEEQVVALVPEMAGAVVEVEGLLDHLAVDDDVDDGLAVGAAADVFALRGPAGAVGALGDLRVVGEGGADAKAERRDDDRADGAERERCAHDGLAGFISLSIPLRHVCPPGLVAVALALVVKSFVKNNGVT